MTKQKSIKRALVLSALSLLMCLSMLVGSTFAWFTDSVTSGRNKIVAGNLDVVLEYKTDWSDTWTAVDENTKIFKENALYEPSYTEVVYLRVSNAGSLALKYNLKVDISAEKPSVNTKGAEFKLSDYLQIGTYCMDEYSSGANYANILFPAMFGTREAALSNVTLSKLSEADSIVRPNAPILPGEQTSQIVAIVLTMPETVGNEANFDSTKAEAPEIDLGISVVATQFTHEYDSFDNRYDTDATLDFTPVANLNQLKIALANKEENIVLTQNIESDETLAVDYGVTISGAGYTLSRAPGFTGTVFDVKANSSLTLEDIIVDGGAVLQTSSGSVVNSGVVATGDLINAGANAEIVLNSGAVLQNNDGTFAVNLGTRIGATLTMNGGWIINNRSGAGAVWGGGHITINEGSKINNNISTGPAGAIRMVGKCNLTMNGGEICNNTAATDGGAIWGYGTNGNSSVYNLNSGKISNNTAGGVGGGIYTGTYSTINISGDFEICDNTAADSGAMRITNYTVLNMTGGKISGNVSTGNENNNGFYGWCPRLTITGGELNDNIYLAGGHTPTIGGDGITGTVYFNIGTNHNTVNLAAEFGSIKFIVHEGGNFAAFNFKPATGYTYTDGDEAKLVCMNSGYETYWDSTTQTFRLRAE